MIRCSLINSLWQLAGIPEARRFLAALDHPEEAQHQLLMRLVRRGAGTDFGRRHGFPSIRSVEDYRSRVPLRDYDGFAPWIERIQRGERGVLTPDPVTRLVPTSGSTRGRKLIPWTRSLGREFNRALAPWVVDLFRGDPELKRGPAYWSISAPAPGEKTDSSAVPIGFDGDSRYLGGLLGALVRPVLAVPESTVRTGDAQALQAETARSLVRCRELRLISVWHPSFLLLLLERAGVDDARAVWPRLGLISCWTDAGAASAIPELRRRFPRVPIQGKGLLATEAFSSIPFQGRRPLAIRSHFFEFVDGDDRSHLAHQLREGETYSLVVSTSGGLFRYRTYDRVQVTGTVQATPTIRFVGRGDRVSDLRGEKLTDGFVQGVLDRLFQGDARVRFAMLAPGPEEGPVAGYTLFLEAPATAVRGCVERLDTLLSGNPHYRHARELGQLRPPEVFFVPEGAHRAYMEALAGDGRRLGAIKPAALDSRRDWHRVFLPGLAGHRRGNPGQS
jgi:hypothetical protein